MKYFKLLLVCWMFVVLCVSLVSAENVVPVNSKFSDSGVIRSNGVNLSFSNDGDWKTYSVSPLNDKFLASFDFPVDMSGVDGDLVFRGKFFCSVGVRDYYGIFSPVLFVEVLNCGTDDWDVIGDISCIEDRGDVLYFLVKPKYVCDSDVVHLRVNNDVNYFVGENSKSVPVSKYYFPVEVMPTFGVYDSILLVPDSFWSRLTGKVVGLGIEGNVVKDVDVVVGDVVVESDSWWSSFLKWIEGMKN